MPTPHRKAVFALLISSAVLTITSAHAALFDDFEDLQGMTVVYAGEFEEVSCPITGKYDCLSWPSTMLKTRKGREVCLGVDSRIRCRYKCRGLIAVGDDKAPWGFVFSDLGGDTTRFRFKSYRCPDPF